MDSIWDTEEGENWMVEEGIGHINRYGNFEHGPAPYSHPEFGNRRTPTGRRLASDQTLDELPGGGTGNIVAPTSATESNRSGEVQASKGQRMRAVATTLAAIAATILCELVRSKIGSWIDNRQASRDGTILQNNSSDPPIRSAAASRLGRRGWRD